MSAELQQVVNTGLGAQPFFCADCDAELKGRGIQQRDGRTICARCARKLERLKQGGLPLLAVGPAGTETFAEQESLFNPETVEGFVNATGFHPIRKSEGYNEFKSGDLDTEKQHARKLAAKESRQREQDKKDHAQMAKDYASDFEGDSASSQAGRSLAQFVRRMGGMVPTKDLAGELRRLGSKELGTTGLINQHARQGSHKQTPEYVMDAANEEGFRDAHGRKFNINTFLAALEKDAARRISRTGRKADTRKQRDRKIMAKAARAYAANPKITPVLFSRLVSALGVPFLSSIANADRATAIKRTRQEIAVYENIASDTQAPDADRAAAAAILQQLRILESNLNAPQSNPLHPLEIISHLAMGLTGVHTGLALMDQYKNRKSRRRRNGTDEDDSAPWDDLEYEATRLGSQQARALGVSQRKLAKFYEVSWHSPRRGRRVSTVRPIKAHSKGEAIAEAKAIATEGMRKGDGIQRPVNFVAREVQSTQNKNPRPRPLSGRAWGQAVRDLTQRVDALPIGELNDPKLHEMARSVLRRHDLPENYDRHLGSDALKHALRSIRANASANPFACLECGHKFRSAAAAQKAMYGDGCPGCGGSDFDDISNDEIKKLKAASGGGHLQGNAFKSTPKHAAAHARLSAKRDRASVKLIVQAKRLHAQAEKLYATGRQKDRKEADILYAKAMGMQRRFWKSGENTAGPVGVLPNGKARIVYNRLLAGWFVVTGPHQAPLSGRFDSKVEARAWLRRRSPKQAKRVPRKNPKAIDQFSEMFHGSVSGSKREIIVSKHVRNKNLARLGALPYLKMVNRPRGHGDPKHACNQCSIVLNPGSSFLCATPQRKLVVGGGDLLRAGKQLRAEFMRENPGKNGEVNLGKVEVFFYDTPEKHSNSGLPILYYHPTAEETRRNSDRPALVIDTAGMLYLKGGRYRIDQRGIIN